LQPVWTPCIVRSHSHALWGGVSKVQPVSGTDRDVVEVNVSKTLKQRAARFAVASGIAFVAIAPTAAMAYPDPNPPSTPTDPGAQVEAAKTTKSATLPFTGGDVAGLAAIGAGAVVAGAVVVRQSRRKAVA
jgi:hypothetical protein